MSDEQRCPTCGSSVRVVQAAEGTAHYEPTAERELQQWTVHACEEYGHQDCAIHGALDVITVVPLAALEQAREHCEFLRESNQEYRESRNESWRRAEAAEAQLEQAREALEFYAGMDGTVAPLVAVMRDAGMTARKALRALSPEREDG